MSSFIGMLEQGALRRFADTLHNPPMQEVCSLPAMLPGTVPDTGDITGTVLQ